MPIPFIYFAGAALVGAGVFGGREFGKEVGEMTGKIGVTLAGSAFVYMAYKSLNK